jgi:hypothetical protein
MQNCKNDVKENKTKKRKNRKESKKWVDLIGV